jgi:hypothetical protein
MLKDDPAFADHLQPTRDNIVSASLLSPLDGCAHLSCDPIWMGLTSDFGWVLAARIEKPRCERGCRGPFHVSL